jgi:Na+-translocating ferredoxin:NAD+ oxidoreductase RnfG subunit
MQATSSFLGKIEKRKKQEAAEACKFVFNHSSSDDSLAQLLIEEKQTKGGAIHRFSSGKLE